VPEFKKIIAVLLGIKLDSNGGRESRLLTFKAHKELYVYCIIFNGRYNLTVLNERKISNLLQMWKIPSYSFRVIEPSLCRNLDS
jgi:hypothetical protein